MKISVICNDGSPLGVTEKSINGDDGRFGVGGAELALLTLCHGWHERGYDVTLYNDPSEPNGSIFPQKGIDAFRPDEDRDVVIIFRSPNDRLAKTTKGQKVWWSCDQYTIGDFRTFAEKVDKIVTISPFHANYFRDMYAIDNTITIDLPVRIWEYDLATEKVPYKCIFNSIPDRGLMNLAPAWEKIVQTVPEAQLYITSDWRLWDHTLSFELVHNYKMRFARMPNVHYLGAIKRSELIQHELESVLHLYPCVYDELFCIAVAETQVAGAIPITSAIGAVGTTNMGNVLVGSPNSPAWIEEFVSIAVAHLQHPDMLAEAAACVQEKALQRFSLESILDRWDREVFNDEQKDIVAD